jgi:hypothetical protein
MKIINLTKGFETVVDDADMEWLSQWNWCVNGHSYYMPYAVSRLGGRIVKMHQLILPAKEGFVPDHIDGNGLNNCRHNLRYATPSQNIQNSLRRNRRLPKGVTHHKLSGKFNARIFTSGKTVSLGYFHDPEEAARAYDAAALEKFGKFAKLNFPEASSLA